MSEKRKHGKINWSPFATNVLDANDFDLCLPDGSPVEFGRANCGRDFLLIMPNGERYETPDNLQMSYWMNTFQVGGQERRRE